MLPPDSAPHAACLSAVTVYGVDIYTIERMYKHKASTTVPPLHNLQYAWTLT